MRRRTTWSPTARSSRTGVPGPVTPSRSAPAPPPPACCSACPESAPPSESRFWRHNRVWLSAAARGLPRLGEPLLPGGQVGPRLLDALRVARGLRLRHLLLGLGDGLAHGPNHGVLRR